MLNNMKKLFSFAAIGYLLVSSPALANEIKEKENKAIQAAQSFVDLIDSGQYDKSWDEASIFFMSQISKAQWVEKIGSISPHFGKTIKRSVKNTKFLTSVPGAPDGEYVIVIFETYFENKKSATESVTPMLEKDGKWRVTGYFIK